MATIKKEENTQFLFSKCLYTPIIKLNIKYQKIFLAIKTNINIMDGIVLYAILY